MRRYCFIFCFFFLLLPLVAYAQEKPGKWTLKACLDYALEHNIQIRKSKVSLLSGEEDRQLAKAQLFPSLSASASQNFANYPSPNADKNNSFSGNYGLNANLKLFDGGHRVNAIRQQDLKTQVNRLNVEQNEDDIRIALIQTYMQVLYAYETVATNRNTVEVSEVQLARSRELYDAGSISQVDLLQIDLRFHLYKIQIVHKPEDLLSHIQFCKTCFKSVNDL